MKRKAIFANDEYYHVFNRGVDKREIFSNCYDYERFIRCLDEFNQINPVKSIYLNDWRKKKGILGVGPLKKSNDSKLIEIAAFCLNHNHFHLIIKQLLDGGVSEFMKRIGGGYTGFYNSKYNRSGSLFQGKFKSTHINTNELLLYLSVYVNANHQIHGYPEKDWPYSSYQDYVSRRIDGLCQKEIILGQFNNNCQEYEKYMKDNIEYFKDKKEQENYTLE